MKTFFNIFILSLLVLGCASKKSKPMELILPKTVVAPEPERLKVLAAEQLLEEDQAARALTAFKDFQKEYPQSVLMQQSRLGEAEALVELQKWSESVEIFSDIVKVTSQQNHQLMALALLKQTSAYEALGEESKVYSSLKDAERFSTLLPTEMALTELPAKLAASLYRQSRYDEAKTYFKKADSGIALLRGSLADKLKSQQVAKIYYSMGDFSTDQISEESIQTQLETLKALQIYTLKSVEMNDPIWSKKAFEGLQENYSNIWNAIQSIRLIQGMEVVAAHRQRLLIQQKMMGSYLQIVNELVRLRNPELSPDNEFEKNLFIFISQLDQKGTEFLNYSFSDTPLTDDPNRKFSLKREGMIYSAPQFDEEKKPKKK